MALKGSTTEEKIWNYLVGNGLSEYGAAGLMGNLYAESGLSPTNYKTATRKSWVIRTIPTRHRLTTEIIRTS